MKCPTCGAENDQANRFCDQCGTRLDQPPAEAAPTGAAMTAGVAVCPTCGAPVLPGEAFCDNCGASLAAPAPDSTAASVTQAATEMPPTTVAPSVPEGTAVPIEDTSSGNVPIVDASSTSVVPDDTSAPAVDASVTAPPADASSTADTSAGPDTGVAPVDASSTVAPVDTSVAPDAAPSTAVDTSVAPDAAAVAPSTSADSDYEARKQQLEDEIARQQQVVTQLEGVQNMLGAGTPAGVVASLDEGRAALTKLQRELDGLQPPQPAVDPAELARLNDEISRQQQVVTQLEGVQNMLGAATPAGVLADLDQARQALAKAQSDLSALGGSAPAAASTPAATPDSSAASAADASASSPAADASAAPAPAADATASAPVAPAAPSGPRLVVEGSGAVIQIPGDKTEIIIGREDPISGIHPEVDLTAHGGESGGVSRQHARMTQSAGQWMLTDLNSTNHTRVDGTRLEPNAAVPISDGAKLQFGRVVMVFHKG